MKIIIKIKRKEHILAEEEKTIRTDKNKESFPKKFIQENKSDIIKILQFIHSFYRDRNVSCKYFVKVIEKLKEKARFQFYTLTDIKHRVEYIGDVFPNYLKIVEHPSGKLLKINRSLQIGKIVNQVNML